jgi:hypothetical protein
MPNDREASDYWRAVLEGTDRRVEQLEDAELDAEITVAAHDPVRRTRRYESLVTELLSRRRGQHTRQPVH